MARRVKGTMSQCVAGGEFVLALGSRLLAEAVAVFSSRGRGRSRWAPTSRLMLSPPAPQLRFEEEERRRKLEAEQVWDLDARLQKLELAEKVRALVAGVRRRAQNSSCVTAEVSAWIEWANGMAADVERAATTMK